MILPGMSSVAGFVVALGSFSMVEGAGVAGVLAGAAGTFHS
jgi:hypothetical protein